MLKKKNPRLQSRTSIPLSVTLAPSSDSILLLLLLLLLLPSTHSILSTLRFLLCRYMLQLPSTQTTSVAYTRPTPASASEGDCRVKVKEQRREPERIAGSRRASTIIAMDFTGQYSFPRNNQSYHQPFMTMPPLTPSHSQSAGSDDFNLTSPTVSSHPTSGRLACQLALVSHRSLEYDE